LPEKAFAKLPSRNSKIVEGTLNGFPFRTSLESNAGGAYFLSISDALREAAGIQDGQAARVEITRIDNEFEPRMPLELLSALAGAPNAQKTWDETTPLARRDWILWITSARLDETRLTRINKAISMLAAGKRRVCCFGGLKWLTKDYPSVETWHPLSSSKKAPERNSSKSQK